MKVLEEQQLSKDDIDRDEVIDQMFQEPEENLMMIENEKASQEINSILVESGVDEEDRYKILAKVSEIYSGPLPPPEAMKKYSEVPNVAETILSMANSEMQHRHDVESRLVGIDEKTAEGRLKVVYESIDLKRRKQLFGFIISILCFVLAFVAMLLDKDVATISMFVTAIGSFCAVMFGGKDKQKSESDAGVENKDEETDS